MCFCPIVFSFSSKENIKKKSPLETHHWECMQSNYYQRAKHIGLQKRKKDRNMFFREKDSNMLSCCGRSNELHLCRLSLPSLFRVFAFVVHREECLFYFYDFTVDIMHCWTIFW